MSLETNVELSTAWEAVQEVLKSQLSAPSYETWISPLRLVQLDSTHVVLEINSTFNRDWVLKNYRQHLLQAIAAVLNLEECPELTINVEATASKIEAEEIKPSAPLELQTDKKRQWTPRSHQSQLNARYTFDQFVVGNHNRFCYSAALAIAETPAQSYNPLFVYGGVGLGKTHLMQAVGHFAHQHHPDLKVKYVTTEQFTNDLISALSTKSMKQFRDRYRRIDILMIDDIQFLEGKDRTQEEIFHTFNTLHEAGKQIIISSDRPPDRLSRLEDRLRSRFSWGLIADIQAPDVETRIAILQQKALEMAMPLTDEVITYVAESFPTNIRELEGALNKLSAYHMLTQCEVDLAQAQTLLGRRFDPSRISHEEMVDMVAHYYHLQRADLQSPLRNKHITHARQVAVYIIRELTSMSFPQIGQLFGGRRHTTMLYAYEKMRELFQSDPTLKQQVQEIMDQIKSRGSA